MYKALCLRYGGYGWGSCTQEKFRRKAHALGPIYQELLFRRAGPICIMKKSEEVTITPFKTADLSQGARHGEVRRILLPRTRVNKGRCASR